MGINSYWWVLNSSAFTETGRKAMQWWTEMGAGKGGDAEHFRTNFPRMPRSTGCPAKGKGVGLHCRGQRVVSSGLVQPFGSFGGLACVYVHGLFTVLTLHSAAPSEFALALGDLLDSRGVVASSAAHDLAAVCATWCLIADSPSCAQGTCAEYKRVKSLILKLFSLTWSFTPHKEATDK